MAECPFCRIAADPGQLVHRGGEVVAFLDRRPLFHGHLLVCPRQHVETLLDIPEDLIVQLLGTVRLAMRALERELGAEGTFVAVNNRVSQSVPHLHVHVVPRRSGDGLRGFFWPRHPYEDEAQMVAMRDRLRRAVAELARGG